MNRETSIFLDLVRFAAALVVCLGHLSGSRLTGGLFWQAGPFMAEAVTLFFVLSGFVIGTVTMDCERTARDYAVARAARIESVALPALLITLALDTAGRAIHPELYSAAWGYAADGQAWRMLAAGLFLNEIWFVHLSPGSMLPYWSLGFEVWYYVLFGLALFAGRWRAVLIPATLLLIGPRVAVLFPLWLMGIGLAHVVRSIRPRAWLGWLLLAGSLALWVGYEIWAWRHGRLLDYGPSVLGRPELLQDYLVGGSFAGLLLGFTMVGGAFAAVLRPVERPVRWLAGATFTLYLLHLPVAQFLTTIVPWPPSAWPTRIVILGGTLAAVFAIAQVTERRKGAWRRAILATLPASSVAADPGLSMASGSTRSR